MARRQVLEIRCDRCSKVETQDIKPGEEKPEVALLVTFQGESVEYEDLCRRCQGAVEGYFKSMTLQSKKDEEEGPKEEELKSRFLGGRNRSTG